MRQISIYLALAFCSVMLMTSCKQTAADTATDTKIQQQKTIQPAAQQRQLQQKAAQQGQTRSLNANQSRPQRPKHEPGVPGGKVNWMTFSEVEKAMKKEKRKVFVDVYTEWCGWCKVLDKATFADKRVADYMNENYYAVKFDAQEPGDILVGGKKYSNPNFDASRPKRARNATHQLAAKYKTRSFPTVLFLDEKLELIKAVPGFRGADQFLPLLAQYNQ